MKTICTLIFGLFFFDCTAQDYPSYPTAPQGNAKDTFWGKEILDPYRPLETDNEKVDQWLKSEKEVTDDYFKKTPHKNDLDFDFRHQLLYHINAPIRSGPYYIESRYALGGMSLYYKDYLRDRPLFLYNTEMVSSKTERFTDAKFSKNGKYCALSYSNTDNTWQEIRILNMSTTMLMKDHIRNVRHSDLTWFQSGFYYAGYDSVDERTKNKDVRSNQRLYYHKVGTDASLDKLIFEDKDNPYNTFSVTVMDDERFVLVQEHFPEDDKTITYLRDANDDLGFKILFTERDARTRIIGSVGDTLLAVTINKNAFNGQIEEIDIKKPLNWGVVVDNQQKYRIKQIIYADDKYCVIFKDGFQEYICLFSRNGDIIKTIPLQIGSSNEMISYSPDQNSIIISRNYYTNPPVGELFSLKDFSLNIIDNLRKDHNFFNYKFYLTSYVSRDGTSIPIYIVTSKDYVKKGSAPALLYVYGGFDEFSEARYNPGVFSFLNNGGIYAVANIRGEASSVKDWHKYGSVLNKQNSIDDTYYAARFLTDSGFALSGQIAITGKGNGAMVAAATINQHPETFRAAVLNVGIYDMVRYENFAFGVFWSKEYGSIDDLGQIKALLSYSPLHNIKANTNYPSILISASEYDDIIPPLHSYKYVAALQQITKSKNPILLNIAEERGHRAGIDNNLVYPFLFRELNMKYNPLSIYKEDK